MAALAALEVKNADDAIVMALQKAEPKVQSELIKILAQRNSTQSVRALIPFIASPDASVSREAIKAIIAMGDAGTIDDLAGLILTSDKSQQIIGAMVAIARRTGNQPKAVATLKEAWSKADGTRKVAILGVLPAVGDNDALNLAKSALSGNDDAVYDAAVRALADWKDSTPIDDVLVLAATAKTDTQKILALRSFIRMIDTEKDADKKFTSYSEAMKLASRDDEKKLVITGLGGVTTLDAYKIVLAFLDNSGLSSEAQISSLKIAQAIKDSHPADVVAGMKKIQAAPVNDWAKDEAAKILKVAEFKLPPSSQK